MVFPVTVPILNLEITKSHLSDTKPTPEEGYEICLFKDLGYTKLWIEGKVVQS